MNTLVKLACTFATALLVSSCSSHLPTNTVEAAEEPEASYIIWGKAGTPDSVRAAVQRAGGQVVRELHIINGVEAWLTEPELQAIRAMEALSVHINRAVETSGRRAKRDQTQLTTSTTDTTTVIAASLQPIASPDGELAAAPAEETTTTLKAERLR